jgi:rfaE bifunctional protein kinase chain/domain
MTTSEILAAFPKMSALVVGDVCLDRWCTYDPSLSEPSRETGIPRTGVVKTEVTPGAAGTVANNLVALGVGRVAVLGAIGDDGFGEELFRALNAGGISSSLCIRTETIQTFTYTKVINSLTGVEDKPRLDFVNTTPLDASVEQEIITRLRRQLTEFDVILISDQAETNQGGIVTAAVRSALSELAFANPEKVVLADSRARLDLFRGMSIKANREETEAACRKVSGKTDYTALLRHTQSTRLFVTHSGEGVMVVDEAGERWVKTRPVENPVDICGAGDSFSAGAAMSLAVTRSAERAAAFGNLVASITIMKKGTGTARPEEVLVQESAGDVYQRGES